MTPDALSRLSPDDLAGLVIDMKEQEAAAIIEQGREAQIEYVASVTDKTYAELKELLPQYEESKATVADLKERIEALRAVMYMRSRCASCLHEEKLHTDTNGCRICRALGEEGWEHAFQPPSDPEAGVTG